MKTLRRSSRPYEGYAMAFVRQRYGKANVRVLRVQRDAGRHEVREARIRVTIDGDFARAYTAADNSSVVPTDTMKNLVNVLALEHLAAANEPFAMTIAHCFLDRYEQVSEVKVEIDETVWNRMSIAGRPHEHNFVRSESGTPFRVRHGHPVGARDRRWNPRPGDHEDHRIGLCRLRAGRVHHPAADLDRVLATRL